MTDRCTQQPQSSASGLQPTIKSANDFRRNGFCLFFVHFFFLVNFLVSYLWPTGASSGSLRSDSRQRQKMPNSGAFGKQIWRLSGEHECLRYGGYFAACLQPAVLKVRRRSWWRRLLGQASEANVCRPRGPTAQHCTPGTACTAAPDSQSRCCSCHQAILVKSSFAGCRHGTESLNVLRTGKAAAAAEEDTMPGEKPSG